MQNDQYEYKLNKCLEKLHEVDLKVTEIQSLVNRMNTVEDKIEKLEVRHFRLTILLVMVLSSLGAHYGVEFYKIMKVIT